MTELLFGNDEQIDVAVIGGGPSGLAAATRLKQRGVSRVVVLEREPRAGGIPRHCGHPPFGVREFKRIMTGPKYAEKLVETAKKTGVEIHTLTTVVEANRGGELLVSTHRGVETLVAKRIIYATGVRETPRSARMISGHRPRQRPLGIVNTGALQSMIYLKNQKPFKRPVIVGSELVSFSAILTCRHANISPVAMIEEREKITARWPYALFPRLIETPFSMGIRLAPKIFGVPLHLGTRLISINGEKKVDCVCVEQSDGVQREIECDGVILTGQFTPEASLALCGHLEVDPHTSGPRVDQYGRCSDPVYYAAGNVLRGVETADWCWNEGRLIADFVADDLAEKLPIEDEFIDVRFSGDVIRYMLPQKIQTSSSATGMRDIQFRFTKTANGVLRVNNGLEIILQKKLRVHPEHRVLVPMKELIAGRDNKSLNITFEEFS